MIGATLGSYRIVSEIGSGGMGVVYLAEHTLLGRKAAVKLLRQDMPYEYVERFFNEAKAAATLHHPGLVDVFDFGHHADGAAYIVMEFLHGESLSQRLEREPRLPVPLALTIARAVALALHVAHEQGIVHRDLKPGNLFLIEDAEAAGGVRTKVLDFGIAKLMRDRDARSVKTQSGAVIGTPRYMSPEQCKNARTVDGRSDIYSLGCILYEMVLGVAPFDYDSWAELVGAHIYEVPAKPSEIDAKISPNVETLICKMLEKAPEDRFNSMQDLAQSLEVLLLETGERVRLTPPSLARPRVMGSSKKHDSGQDRTLVPAPKPVPTTLTGGAFADTDVEQATSPTLPPDQLAEAVAVAAASVAAKKQSTGPVPTATEADITTSPVARKGKTPWIAISIGAAGLVALGIAVALVLAKRDKPESETAFIVVEQRGSDGSARKPVEAPIAVSIDAAVAESDTNVPVDARAASTPAKRPSHIDVAALGRTFNKQSPAITACFKQHGEPTDQVLVRFQIDDKGSVITATVLPDSVAATPLGACLADLAKHTAFGPQPEGAAFKVPLYRKGG